ncbi:MAG: hypothetical protein ACOYOK_01535 [Pseudobdellovibrionaceae bacterium]
MTKIASMFFKNPFLSESKNSFVKFDELNGWHPWQEAVPEGYVLYQVRQLNAGKVVYFNFPLAAELGLLHNSKTSSNTITPELEAKLLETFSLQIINEYDELSKKRIDPTTIKPNKYMATRYLQLQHADKTGKTSGDGRGIWNGVCTHKDITWDISSRGTGVTCLAPGAVEAGKPLKTGSEDFGYGCGMAEIDELLSAAISAEVMHLQGLQTERVLCIIDLGKGMGIGVRAAKNLFRPAHLFLYLKQNRKDLLRQSFNFFIDRQIQNKRWTIKNKFLKYEESLNHLSRSFADFAAILEVDYIFAWLDWDGDNVLADADIIDYGSVRQFGICHDKYRYDDVQRFSTNLKEQKAKARQMVMTFVQMVDYLRNENKKNISQFKHHKVLKDFDRMFEVKRNERFLYRMGFTSLQRKNLIQHKKSLSHFNELFQKLETLKINGGVKKVADGVNHPPVFNMRKFLKEFPSCILKQNDLSNITMHSTVDFIQLYGTHYLRKSDRKKALQFSNKIQKLQESYIQLLEHAFSASTSNKYFSKNLKTLVKRSNSINSENRITGNALIEIVDQILAEKGKGLKNSQIQNLIDKIISEHANYPEIKKSNPCAHFYKHQEKSSPSKIYQKLMLVVAEHQEDI